MLPYSACCGRQGGRVASAVAHVQPASTLGCVFFSYPLHPPRKQVCSGIVRQPTKDPLYSA